MIGVEVQGRRTTQLVSNVGERALSEGDRVIRGWQQLAKSAALRSKKADGKQKPTSSTKI